jgi:hypothetical protein
MSLAPGGAPASVSPAEMQVLMARAGLVLNPGQTADLVLVWRQLAALIASLPRERPMVDDFAFAFRLPPPAAPSTEAAAAGRSTRLARAAAAAKPAAKPAGAKAKRAKSVSAAPAKAKRVRKPTRPRR